MRKEKIVPGLSHNPRAGWKRPRAVLGMIEDGGHGTKLGLSTASLIQYTLRGQYTLRKRQRIQCFEFPNPSELTEYQEKTHAA
jgi:hypothetical protein